MDKFRKVFGEAVIAFLFLIGFIILFFGVTFLLIKLIGFWTIPAMMFIWLLFCSWAEN